MFYDDKHSPHFHVVYVEYQALVSIDDGSLIAGDLPNRAYQLVLEWQALHRAELKTNWENARKKKPLKEIAPLK